MNNNNALAQIRLLVAQQHPNWTNQQVVNFVNQILGNLTAAGWTINAATDHMLQILLNPPPMAHLIPPGAHNDPDSGYESGGAVAHDVPADQRKFFPKNYSEDAAKIIKTMAFSDGIQVLGSMSLRDQIYAGDFDCYEKVVVGHDTDENAAKALAKDFQAIVRNCEALKDVYIGDIKAGLIEAWRVVPVDADKFRPLESIEKLKYLQRNNIINNKEAQESIKLIESKFRKASYKEMSDVQRSNEVYLLQKKIKFHIVRWRPDDVARGFKILRNKTKFTLAEAFLTPMLAKLDVVGFVENSRYTDFSCLYEFWNKNKELNPDPLDFIKSIKKDIIALKLEGNKFKALKRIFSLARYQENTTLMAEITPILNSDLGRLYQVISDIGTIRYMLQEHAVTKDDHLLKNIHFEIDQFVRRLSNVTRKDFVAGEGEVLDMIKFAVKQSKPAALDSQLEKIESILNKYLQTGTPTIRYGEMGDGEDEGYHTKSSNYVPGEAYDADKTTSPESLFQFRGRPILTPRAPRQGLPEEPGEEAQKSIIGQFFSQTGANLEYSEDGKKVKNPATGNFVDKKGLKGKEVIRTALLSKSDRSSEEEKLLKDATPKKQRVEEELSRLKPQIGQEQFVKSSSDFSQGTRESLFAPKTQWYPERPAARSQRSPLVEEESSWKGIVYPKGPPDESPRDRYRREAAYDAENRPWIFQRGEPIEEWGSGMRNPAFMRNLRKQGRAIYVHSSPLTKELKGNGLRLKTVYPNPRPNIPQGRLWEELYHSFPERERSILGGSRNSGLIKNLAFRRPRKPNLLKQFGKFKISNMKNPSEFITKRKKILERK